MTSVEKKRLFISFSGGRTSGFMTKRLLETLDFEEWDVLILFANTGAEDERTLRFVKACETWFGRDVLWIEAVPNPVRGKGTGWRVVTYETASRNGEPFRDVISKHGIPNKAFPHCTRELKERPMLAFLRTIGWKAGTFYTAIGIRADEMDRISASAESRKLIYPLIKWGTTKTDVLDFWRQQPFDLFLPEHRGNCVWCWKKSLRKHLTLLSETPEAYAFPEAMEREFPFAGPGQTGEPRRFFRGHKTVADLRAEVALGFTPFVDGNERFETDLDEPGGCGDSCEVFTQ